MPQLTANHSLPVLEVVDILRQISNRTRILWVIVGLWHGNMGTFFTGNKYLLNHVTLEKESGCVFKTLESWNNGSGPSKLYSEEK